MIKCYECENVAASGDNYICMCVRCALLPLLLLQNNANGYESTLLRYIWQRVLDEKADTTEETQAVAASDYVGDEGDDDDDCRCHGNTKR